MDKLPTMNPIYSQVFTKSGNSLAPRMSSPVPTGQLASKAGAGLGSALGVAGAASGNIALSLLGMLLSSGTQLAAQKMQIDATNRANEKSRQYALADRAHDELYNSPAMQKLRLKEAGLSPASFIGNFETSSQETPVQVPDFSYLANAGAAGISGMQNMAAFNEDTKRMQAGVDLLKAQAKEAQARADAAEEHERLALANLALQNSYLGKELDLIDLSISGQGISNEQAAFSLAFDKSTSQFRYDALELANRISHLDEQQKAFVLEYSKVTKDLQIQLLSGQVKGVRLMNDLHTLEIKGKKYEIENILPEELKQIQTANKISEEQRQLLVYAVHGAKMKDKLSTEEYNAIAAKMDKYIKLVQKRLDLDYETASVLTRSAATKIAFNQKYGYSPIVEMALSF